MIVSDLFNLDAHFNYSTDWEMKHDQIGRVFYIDHLNHHTQWERPRPAIGGRFKIHSEVHVRKTHIMHCPPTAREAHNEATERSRQRLRGR